jgi:hypothetical protein
MGEAKTTLTFGGENGYDDSFEITEFNGGFNIEINSPWAGDTETGFGQSLGHRLSIEEAEQLRDWLTAMLAASSNGRNG